MNFFKDVLEKIAALSTAVGALGSNQTFTATETEACVAGDVAVMETSGGVIPFSSLEPTKVTEIGGELDTVIGGNDFDLAVDWITDNAAVYAYRDVTVSNNGTVTPVRLEADGSTIIGSNFIFSAVDATTDIDISSINNGRLALTYVHTATIKAKAGQLNSETLYISFGAEAELEAVDSDHNAICQTDDDKFAVIYADATNSDGNVIVSTVNSSTLAITTGTKATVGAGDITDISACKVTTDKIACAYEDQGADTDGFSNIITTVDIDNVVVGNAIEFNDAVTVKTAITALDTTHIVIFYRGGGDNVVGRAICASISGTIPTYGSAVQLSEGTDNALSCNCVAINSAYFLAVWDNYTDGKTGFSVSSVSGTTITAGTRKYLANDFMPPQTHGSQLSINSYNDITCFGIVSSVTYAIFMDVGWVDDTLILTDISGVVEDDSGTIIVDGIDEGNASGEDSKLTYFWDGRYKCVRKKTHSCQYPGYVPRVRVLDADCLKAIGG